MGGVVASSPLSISPEKSENFPQRSMKILSVQPLFPGIYQPAALVGRKPAFSGRHHPYLRVILILGPTSVSQRRPLRVELIKHIKTTSQSRELIPPLMALSRTEHPWLVSINFTHDELRRLLASKAGLRRGVQQRIADNLERLDRPLHLFVLEQHKGRWHLHGVVGLSPDGEDELRRALRGLAGKSTDMMRRHLVHIQQVDNGRSFKGEYGLRG